MLVGFEDIKYNKKLPVAELRIEQERIAFVDEKGILLKKLQSWKYEKETRLLAFYKHPSDERNIGFDKKSVTGIIFGERMSIEDRNSIRNLITNDENYSLVKFYEAFKDFKSLKMKTVKC